MSKMSLPNLVLSITMFLTGIASATAQPGGGEVCSAFRDGKVAPEIVAEMLQAAAQGHLYRVKPESSRVEFCVDHALAGRIHGEFRQFQGGVSLTPEADGRNRALLLVRADSIHTGNAVVEALARDDLFFDTERYPEILFVSRRFEIVEPGRARLHGELTMHGVTRPVVFDVEVDVEAQRREGDAGRRIALTAQTTLRRSDFGMTRLRGLVGDEVTLCLKFVVEPIPPQLMATG